ncbi:hypothetical protein EZV62_010706 [Acer yangbiense]|uniref:beta-N-acetylhexosaminidase n=1 Tax=Acer yangbiense TaxID=1000413 RepID=A0A5C7I5B9_9ROSI|nr:hypothetical protein EZV62_010706 [Acer yangbiense]
MPMVSSKYTGFRGNKIDRAKIFSLRNAGWSRILMDEDGGKMLHNQSPQSPTEEEKKRDCHRCSRRIHCPRSFTPSSTTVRRRCCLHSSKQLLLAIDILTVALACRSSNLGGAVLDKSLQPHELHIPFILQFMNVFHWHVVDTQSFPLGIPSYPKLWDGAYSIQEGYTMADAAEIVRQVIDGILLDRAAAAAERLWTTYDNLAKDPVEVIGRLTNSRCLLNRRGVAVAPLLGLGHTALVEPRSCYSQ